MSGALDQQTEMIIHRNAILAGVPTDPTNIQALRLKQAIERQYAQIELELSAQQTQIYGDYLEGVNKLSDDYSRLIELANDALA